MLIRLRPGARAFAAVSGLPAALVIHLLSAHGFPLLRLESALLAAAALLVSGGSFLALRRMGLAWAHALLSALLGLEIAFGALTFIHGRMGAAGLLVALAAAFFLARRFKAALESGYPFFAAAALAAALSAALLTSAPTWRKSVPRPAGQAASRGLPPLFVFILDAHASLGEIARLEPGSGVARRLERSYAGNGFTIYRNAYANFQETILSVPSILNFELAPYPGPLGATYFALPRNRLFEKLIGYGYRPAVYQGTYIDYARSPAAPVSELSIYDPNSARYLDAPRLAAADKTSLLLRHLMSDSPSAALRAWAPSLGPSPSFYGALSFDTVLDEILSDISRGGSDRAYFAHLVAPHAPFIYDAECRAKPSASWVEERCFDCEPKKKSAAYQSYLEQVQCTHAKLESFYDSLKRAGLYNDSCIVLFGDHGSNIRDSSTTSASTEEKRHNFSSFLAVKGGACGVLSRPAGVSPEASKPTAELINGWFRVVPPEAFSDPRYKKFYDRTVWE